MNIPLGILAVMFAVAVMGSRESEVRQVSLIGFMATLAAIVWRAGL